MSKVVIENDKAVRRIEFDLSPGSVVELCGPNGSGKTTVIEAVSSAIGGGKLQAEPRDGVKAGLVEVDGVTLRIGKRVTRSGEPETFVLIEDGDQLGLLIDPQVADPEAANRKRLQAMIGITGFEVSDDAIKELVGDQAFASVVASGKIKGTGYERVASLKRALEELARDSKAEAVKNDGALSQIGPAVDISVPLDMSQEELDKLIDRKTIEAAAADSALQVSEQARKTLESMVSLPDVSVIEERLCEVNARLQTTEARIKELEILKQSLLQERSSEQSRLESAKSMHSDRDAALAVIKESVDPDRPAALRSEIQDLKARREKAILDAQARRAEIENEKKRINLRAKIAVSKERAEHFSSIAQQTHVLLAGVLHGVPGFSIGDSLVLMCDHERGVVPFAELGPGERAKRAVKLLCRLRKTDTGKKRLVVIPQHIWESIDAFGRSEIVKLASDEGLCILTGQCVQTRTCACCASDIGISPQCPICGSAEMYGDSLKAIVY